MSAELVQWAWQATVWTSAAIVLVVPLRWGLARLFGRRVSILAWALVPLVCVATMLPPRTVEYSVPVAAETATPVSPSPTDAVTVLTTTALKPRIASIAVAAAWTAGALAWLLIFGMRQRALGQRIGVRRCSGRICVSDASRVGPMVVGVFRPRVILPADFRSRFRRHQRRLVLAHELTHIRRRDPLWNLVAATFQCLLWFNPLVHWAASRFRRDQELACDAAVLESRSGAKREYAGALLQLDHPPSFGLPAFGGHPLKERIRMLKRIRNDSPLRRRMGITAAALLALGISVAAWAADAEVQEAGGNDMFSFDIEVIVDGVSEEGTLTVTGNQAVVPVAGGKPRFLAREKLQFDHESEDSGWSAEIQVERMPDERFLVDARILRDGETVSTPRLIVAADKPAHIETSDPETGESTYRIDITPVDVSSPVVDGAAEDQKLELRSAQVFLTVDGNTAGKRVEWPGEPGASVQVGFSYIGEPQPWNAQVGVERLDEEKVKMCVDKLELALEGGIFSASAGCMTIDVTAGKNGYMFGTLGEIGVSFRMDMVPNVHDQIATQRR